MSLFGGTSTEYAGFVLNFAQNEPYSGNYLVGMIPEREGHKQDFPIPMRNERMEYKFHPAGAKTREESQKLVEVKPKESVVYTFPGGMVDPMPVHMIFPDEAKMLPQALHQSGGQGMPSLGAVFQRVVYQNEVMLDMLRAAAEQDRDMLTKMRDNYVNSDAFDEDRLDEMQRIMQTVTENMPSRRGRKR